MEKEVKWEKYNDTLVCPNCGFGYFPTDTFFLNHEVIKGKYVATYCPMCGQKNADIKK